MAGVFSGFWSVGSLAAPSVVVTSSAEIVAPGGTATFTATPTMDPSVSVASYLWVATRYNAAGASAVVTGTVLSASNVAAPTLTAEVAADDYAYDCACTVTDSAGAEGTGRHTVRVVALEAPSGSIGTNSSQANLNAITADASSLVGATSWAWTVEVDEDADTSGYVSAAAFADAAAETTTITPDGPGVYTLVCAATGPGGTQPFSRKVTVTQTAPSASLAAIVDQLWLGQITLSSAGSSGTGIARSWAIEAAPSGSTAALSSTGDVASPTFSPDLAGTYRFRVTVTDDYGRTSAARRTWQVGDEYGRLWANLGAAPDADPGGILDGTPTHQGGGIFRVPVLQQGGAVNTLPTMARWTVTLPQTFAEVPGIHMAFTARYGDVDNLIGHFALTDDTTPTNGLWGGSRAVQSAGRTDRGNLAQTGTGLTYTNGVGAEMVISTIAHVFPGARIDLVGDGVIAGAYSGALTIAQDASGIPAAGNVLLHVLVGASAAMAGAGYIDVGFAYRSVVLT